MKIRRLQKAFSLVELLVVVVIIGILASIAIPAYSDYLNKSRRSDARTALVAAAQALEKFYTENQTYLNATLGSGAGDVYPAISPNSYYNLDFSVTPTASVFTVRATPTGVQSNDKCGNFTLTSTGVKDVTGGTLTATNCW